MVNWLQPAMNPYDRYLSKEDLLTKACVELLGYKYPNLLFFHTPNEGKRTKFEQYKAKLLGMKAGIPDLLIFLKANQYPGIACELKIKPNKCTPFQEIMLKRFEAQGWKSVVIYSFDEFEKLMKTCA